LDCLSLPRSRHSHFYCFGFFWLDFESQNKLQVSMSLAVETRINILFCLNGVNVMDEFIEDYVAFELFEESLCEVRLHD